MEVEADPGVIQPARSPVCSRQTSSGRRTAAGPARTPATRYSARGSVVDPFMVVDRARTMPPCTAQGPPHILREGYPMLMIDLQGHVAVVTGASGGLGAAIARTLVGAGVAVVNYATNRGAAKAVVAAIRAYGGRAIAQQADVSAADAVEAMVARELRPVGHRRQQRGARRSGGRAVRSHPGGRPAHARPEPARGGPHRPGNLPRHAGQRVGPHRHHRA